MAQPYDLSLVPGARVKVEGENWSAELFSDLHMRMCGQCVFTVIIKQGLKR